jgi:hypothetical protein
MAERFSQQQTLAQSSPAACQDTLFSTGWQVPWRSCSDGRPAVPWETVQELLLMARDALVAKQRAAEVGVCYGNGCLRVEGHMCWLCCLLLCCTSAADALDSGSMCRHF